MVLETLLTFNEINGVPIRRVEWNQPSDNFIEINDKHNAIMFKIQKGPIKEVGVNGCQVDTLIHTARIMVEGLDAKFPCEENKAVLLNLNRALLFLDKRTKDRTDRGVEGKNEA